MAVVAIDFGGTSIKFGVIGEGGEILAFSNLVASPTDTIQKNLEAINELLLTLLSNHAIPKGQLRAIGIAVPSIVGNNNQVLSRYVKYTDAGDFDFNSWAMSEWGLPITVENDARAALVGEWKYGAGKGYSDIALLTLGTGVGSAVISEGKLFKGKHFLGGSLTGHMSINMHGTACNCGFFGCLESEASTWALPGIASRHPLFKESSLSTIENLAFIHLFEAAANGDELANLLLLHCLKAWGVCAVNLVHAHDPEIIIISGGIMKRQEQILPFLQKMVDEYAWLPPGTIIIKAAQQVEYAGLLGMEFLANSSVK
jgi:glucokinase